MAHGHKDWGFALGDTYILAEDLAELAARLGSLHVFDRRGKVMWCDDFRGGMQGWLTTLSGTGAAVVLDTILPKWSPFHVKLTGGSDGVRRADLIKFLSPYGVQGIGFEASIAFPTSFSYLNFNLRLWDGTDYHIADIKLDDVNGKITYADGDLAYQDITTWSRYPSTTPPYVVLKLVADLSADTYTRFIINDTEHDLSVYSLYTSTSTQVPCLSIRMMFCSRSGENDYCYVDGVIVTQEES